MATSIYCVSTGSQKVLLTKGSGEILILRTYEYETVASDSILRLLIQYNFFKIIPRGESE